MVPRTLVVIKAGILLLTLNSLSIAQIIDAPKDQGSSNRETIQQAQASTAGSLESDSEVQQTGWWTLPMPQLTMPQIEMPKLTMPQLNSFWPSGERQTSATPSPFAPLVAGGQKISAGSKKAWAGLREMLSFGDGGKTARTSRIAAKKKPSMWKRMFVPSPPQPDGPRTVAEWMDQPRLDP